MTLPADYGLSLLTPAGPANPAGAGPEKKENGVVWTTNADGSRTGRVTTVEGLYAALGRKPPGMK